MTRRTTTAEREVDEQVSRFAAERLVYDAKLVVPCRVLWNGFKGWCDEGFEDWPLPTYFFASLARAGVEFHTRGRGRLRRVAHGVGFRQDNRNGKAA